MPAIELLNELIEKNKTNPDLCADFEKIKAEICADIARAKVENPQEGISEPPANPFEGHSKVIPPKQRDRDVGKFGRKEPLSM